ncbi:MAG TPA: DUF4097 family beta strand repeat-containing protein, partial [Chloroflexota bacterium]|nr:DUF4097 family beta strand repeat-containing protein [Chloroflexota bacterium]
MSLERVFSAEALQAIEITLRRGNVLIETGQVDSVMVIAELGSGTSEADLQFEESSGTLRIQQVGPAGVFGGLGPLGDFGLSQLGFPIGRIDLRLTIPSPPPRFFVTTGLGTVNVADWTGEVKVQSGKGEIILGSGKGQVDVKSGMGAVHVAGFSERCAIATGMGDVIVDSGQGAVTVQSGLGRICLADVTGKVEAQTGKGDITLDRAFGNAELKTGFGEIQVHAARGLAVDAKTGKGGLEFAGDFESIQARSGFGGVVIRAEDLRGSVDVTTGRGGIEVDLATTIAIRIDAASRRGNIESQVPLVRVGQPGPEGFFSQRMVGTLGEGDIKKSIRLRSGAGNIGIRTWTVAEAPASVGVSSKPAPATPEPVTPPPVEPVNVAAPEAA